MFLTQGPDSNYKGNDISGVPFFNASNAKAGPGIEFSSSNPEFGKAFVNIIAQQRFWNRDIY